MYQLVDTLYARHTGANGSNILWGFDKDATQYISDKDGIYGNSLWTKRVQSLAGGKFKETDYMDSDVQDQSWYKRPGTDTVYYNYKVVYDDATSASLNRLVTGSAHRTRLTITTNQLHISREYSRLISSPTDYSLHSRLMVTSQYITTSCL